MAGVPGPPDALYARAVSRVLVVTGGLITPADRSLWDAIRKQAAALRRSEAVWLDLQVKLHAAERLLAQARHRRSAAYRRAPYRAAVDRFFDGEQLTDAPELTEVILATMLRREGLEVEVATYTELFADDALRERLLDRCEVVFASTTLLHDRAEMEPMLAMLRRPHNRVVAGGALASMIHGSFEGSGDLDVLAIGYGEYLVPALADWIRGGFETLEPPPTGRLERRGPTTLLFSGVPETKSLDDLPAPDWRIASELHGRAFPLVHYESVRGCPYRCSFCNYPYLFDDMRFRFRSAERIDRDWADLEAQGARWVSCLDSLFTMPRSRLRELCKRLVARGSTLSWLCYARADDLCDPDTVRMMIDAGCRQVQIGVESGSDAILRNMNKACSVDKNRRALEVCRAEGLTTLVTVIVGFPGETPATVDATFELLRSAPPDVFYVAPFSTWVESVPVLSGDSRKKFGLVTLQKGVQSPAPYWSHDTMTCTEVASEVRRLNRRLMEERVGLEGFLFYEGLLGYDPSDRDALLDYQRDVLDAAPLVRGTVRALDAVVQRALDRDVRRRLGPLALASR